MACNFGWDWGPDLATVGIWKPVSARVVVGRPAGEVRPLVSVSGDAGTVRVVIDLERAPGTDGDLPVAVTVGRRQSRGAVPGRRTPRPWCEVAVDAAGAVVAARATATSRLTT